jgi:uncharacterized radical SAM superfamily Fe-S cluster-containing enzyme
MIKIKRVLGSEKCYELLDGRKIPFAELDKLQREEIKSGAFIKPIKKKTTKKKTTKKKVIKNESGSTEG